MVIQTLRSPLFIITSTLFMLHQLLQYALNIHLPIADNYLDNLLAMPIILTLLLAERRWLFKRGATYKLPSLDIVLTTLYISIISELLFPYISNLFTFDWIDFLFFFAGAALYLLFERKTKAELTAHE